MQTISRTIVIIFVLSLVDPVYANHPAARKDSLQPQVAVTSGFAVATEHASQLIISSSELDATEDSYSSLGKSTCESEKALNAKGRVAIVSETSDPPALETWLRYHTRWPGITKFFLCFEEEPPWASAVLSSSEFKGYVEVITPSDIDRDGGRGSFEGLQSRQESCVNEGLIRARQQGFDWLLHIDDDELIYLPDRFQLPEVLDKIPAAYGSVHFQNVELVVSKEKDPQNCFLNEHFFRTNLHSFVAYTNGKSATRVKSSYASSYYGPHQFVTNSKELDTTKNWTVSHSSAWPWPVILHYESCPFARWLRKFWLARTTRPVMLKFVPFPFYRESTSSIAACAKNLNSCDVRGLRSYYSSMKVAKPAEPLFEANLPWEEILCGEENLLTALKEDRLLLELNASRTSKSSPQTSSWIWQPPDPEQELVQFLVHVQDHHEL